MAEAQTSNEDRSSRRRDEQAIAPFFSGLRLALALASPAWVLIAVPLWGWLG